MTAPDGRVAGRRVVTVGAVGGCAVSLAMAACLPAGRANADCRWTGDTAALAPPGDPARRAHLLEDVRVAVDLGIRHGDAVGGRRAWPPNLDARARCTNASLAEIARRHAVAQAEVTALVGAREPFLLVDLLAVFAPMGVLFVLASRAMVVPWLAESGPGRRDRLAARLALVAPCAAAVALVVTQTWGAMVETLRTGNEHIGPRFAQLPADRHGWIVWAAAVGLFAAVAIVALARVPTSATARSSD